jgi:hypothetical protein
VLYTGTQTLPFGPKMRDAGRDPVGNLNEFPEVLACPAGTSKRVSR